MRVRFVMGWMVVRTAERVRERSEGEREGTYLIRRG